MARPIPLTEVDDPPTSNIELVVVTPMPVLPCTINPSAGAAFVPAYVLPKDKPPATFNFDNVELVPTPTEPLTIKPFAGAAFINAYVPMAAPSTTLKADNPLDACEVLVLLINKE